jgi:hypothetical protein
MLNVIELENRWKTYKIKSFIPHAIITASVLLITAISYSFLQPKEETVVADQPPSEQTALSKTIKAPVQTQSEPKVETPAVHEVKEVPVVIQPLKQDTPVQYTLQENKKDIYTEEKIKLTPSLSFINEMNSNIPYYQSSETSQEKSDDQNVYQSQKQELEDEAVQEKSIEQVQEVKAVKIERKNTQDDILQVIERFKKSNDPALSLFVAKKYYELGDYHKSYNYALITNELNNNIEASWIIFAKSLVKLNEKEMALKTLRQYIEHSGSNQAKLLLDEIRNGKFK